MRKETFLGKGFLDLPKTSRRIEIDPTVLVLKPHSPRALLFNKYFLDLENIKTMVIAVIMREHILINEFFFL